MELFEDITEMLVESRLDVGIKLDSSVEQTLRNARRTMQSYVLIWGPLDEIDFRIICLAFETTWDNRIRNLTPDLPTFLSLMAPTDLSIAARYEVMLLMPIDSDET